MSRDGEEQKSNATNTAQQVRGQLFLGRHQTARWLLLPCPLLFPIPIYSIQPGSCRHALMTSRQKSPKSPGAGRLGILPGYSCPRSQASKPFCRCSRLAA